MILQIPPELEMTNDQFFHLCQLNPDYPMERTATGELMIMSPAGSETGNRNLKLVQQLANWTDKDGTGIAFDSSAGFTLPNGATRAPDAAWINLKRWNAIPGSVQVKFAPLCPDFVVELRSPTDSLPILKDKLQEYMENGASLGWLIDRQNRQVYIYRPSMEVECLNNPATVSGYPILPGFLLNLQPIW
ncbi:MAG: Uma2 family endonuclease [Prochloron sp. SP5CPC1]|nr:Uma2 family endonuclease [Candidatus Paraprochloron terpiosi SP5CPC1]